MEPATQELKIVPLGPGEPLTSGIMLFMILHGFGYDHVRNDYKLIRHVRYFDSTEFLARDSLGRYKSQDSMWQVYSLRSNSWKKLDVNMPIATGNTPGERIYIDGICHWWGVDESESYDDGQRYLCSFDLSNEEFLTTPITSSILDNLYLVVLNGSVGLISWYFCTNTFHISILGELGVKESWTKLFVVGPLSRVLYPIGGKNDDIYFLDKLGKVTRFDLNTHLIEEFDVGGDQFSNIFIYKKNLLSIGGMNY